MTTCAKYFIFSYFLEGICSHTWLSTPPPLPTPPIGNTCSVTIDGYAVENLSLWQSSAVLCNVLFSQEIK